MDIIALNSKNWEEKVRQKNPWTVPVDSEVIQNARNGNWCIMLTAQKPVPGAWFPPLKDKRILCLASGGGQQGPVLAAAGAYVTVLDISEAQLEQDRSVARKENLNLHTVRSSMTDLSMFDNDSFDIIVHPVSNVFIPHIQPVWNEAFRVLKKGGVLMSGFMNPVFYMFERKTRRTRHSAGQISPSLLRPRLPQQGRPRTQGRRRGIRPLPHRSDTGTNRRRLRHHRIL